MKVGPVQFTFGNTHTTSVPVAGAVAIADLDELEDDDDTPYDPGPALRPPRTKPVAPKTKITSTNLVELAQARLVELKTELAALAALQAEHDALERLVSAALP